MADPAAPIILADNRIYDVLSITGIIEADGLLHVTVEVLRRGAEPTGPLPAFEDGVRDHYPIERVFPAAYDCERAVWETRSACVAYLRRCGCPRCCSEWGQRITFRRVSVGEGILQLLRK